MPEYIANLLKQLTYTPKVQHSPYEYVPVKYGVKNECQLATQDYDSPLLPKKDIRPIQSIVGKILYYLRSLDHTTLLKIKYSNTRNTKSC